MGLTQVNSGGINDNSIVNADLHSAANIASTKLAKPIDLADNEKVRFGTGGDLEIYHSGSHSFIDDTGTGGLYIRGANNIGFRDAANSYNAFADFTSGGSAELYYNGSKKFATKSDGIDVQGEVQCDSLDVDGATDFAGNIVLNGANYNAAWDYSTSKLKFNDNAKAAFGTSSDLQIYHDGSNSYIKDTGTGGLIIETNGHAVDIKHGSEYCARFKEDADVELYFNNSVKLETKSDGVNIQGELECDSLDVDGSSAFEGVATFGGNYTSFNNNGYIRGDVSGVFQLQAGSSNTFRFVNSNNNTTYAEVTNGGFNPGANNTFDLGHSSLRWRNVYTNDLNLSNEGSTNDVDGTWGNYTIQEGEDDLFLINRRNGKKYKFNLTEVN